MQKLLHLPYLLQHLFLLNLHLMNLCQISNILLHHQLLFQGNNALQRQQVQNQLPTHRQ